MAAALLVPYISMPMLFMLDGTVAIATVLLVSAWFHRIGARIRLASGVA